MGINIYRFLKYCIILLITSICFIIPLYSEVIDPEKINNSILNPAVLVPTEEEENGLKLKVVFDNELKITNDKNSARYYDLEYDKENNVINCRVSSREGSSDFSWKIRNTGNSGEYTVEGFRRGKLTFNNERKPVSLEYNQKRVNEAIEEIFIDQGKFYIPSEILKPGDAWAYYFTDIKNFSPKETSEPEYYKIEVKAVFKLSGYKDYDGARAAVITSQIWIRKVFVLLYDKKTLQVKGGTYIYDITSVNQLLIDCKTGSPLYCTTGILQKVKGALHYNWGNTPEKAEQNVIDNYDGFINANETKYTVYYVKYFNPRREKAYSDKKK